MFIFLRKKLNITPYRLDLIKIISLSLATLFSLYTWPVTALSVVFPFAVAFVITELIAFNFLNTHLWTLFYKNNTKKASQKLIKQAENNQLTRDDAEWLLMPGLLRDKANFVGGSNLGESETVLHWLAHHGRKDLIIFMLEKGASIQSSFLGVAPFHIAVCRNHINLFDILFFDDKQLRARKCLSRTPLEFTVMEGYDEAFAKLTEKLTAPLSTQDKELLLLKIITKDNEKILKVFHEKFGDPFDVLPQLLHLATNLQALKCIQYLLQFAKNKHLNLQNSIGLTAVDLAFINNSPCYPPLIEKGAAINATTVESEKARRTTPILSSFETTTFKPFPIDSPRPLPGESAALFARRAMPRNPQSIN